MSKNSYQKIGKCRCLDYESETLRHIWFRWAEQYLKNYLVEANGVEPMTLCVQGRCSSQLSYAPDYCQVLTRQC